MLQSVGKSGHIPRMRESVAHKEILVFIHFLPLEEVGGIAHGFAYLLGYVKQTLLLLQSYTN